MASAETQGVVVGVGMRLGNFYIQLSEEELKKLNNKAKQNRNEAKK